jgi:hypothetical protein
MVRTNTGFMYREALLTTATGDCSADTGFPSSGGSGGAFDWLLLLVLMLIAVVRYRTSRDLPRRYFEFNPIPIYRVP